MQMPKLQQYLMIQSHLILMLQFYKLSTTVMTFTLPTELTLVSCFDLPKEIEISTDIHEVTNGDQNKQVAKFIQSNHPVFGEKYYPERFVRLYLLIKLNSLSKKQCNVNPPFLHQLKKVYNSTKLNNIAISQSQSQILSQIISKIQGNPRISQDQLVNIFEGNGLLATSCIWLTQQAQNYMKKQEIAFCLSFVALGGRQMAFTPIVHKQKNHAGQIQFAKRVYELVHVEQKSKKQQIKVQDPYSMRCSPQVHGVAYDCLEEIKCKVNLLINKPHHKFIEVNGKTIQNLLLESDTFSLKMDFLICTLQEIGAMSFLRIQRILNQYLGKNKLKRKQSYSGLYSMMNSALTMASKNKLLSEMTNFDTSNTDSYNKDIFYNPGSYYSKITELFYNLYFIMTTQILCSLEALRDAYEGHPQDLTFSSKQMQSNFKYLAQSTSSWDRGNSFIIIRQKWIL